MINPLPHRYPGLKPFERAQSALFYGRGEDVQRLGNLILRERLVVLFAKSGIGKTSILQAGVAPELEKKGYLPIFLRADNTSRPVTEAIREALEQHPNIGGRNEVERLKDTSMGLWEVMKRLEFDIDGLPATPVLVFDQFEEIFTLNHKDASRWEFLHQLADLVSEDMPEKIRNELLLRSQQNAAPLKQADAQWWEEKPNIRIAISIRSDFLHLLDEISPLIPGILGNRYQLQPLSRRQAREAIESPAAAAGRYACPVFQYSNAAIDEILTFLSGKQSNTGLEDGFSLRQREEIESFNLQILCRHIEEKIIAEQHPEHFVVTPAYYGGKEGMEAEIKHFYGNQLRTLPAAYTRRTGKNVKDPDDLMLTARRLIEESLVTPIGRRCSMVDDYLSGAWNVSADFLDTLVDSRLLRKEMRLDDFYYEISHDTLLPAIIESRDERRRQEQADEEKAQLESRLQEEAKRREAIEAELKSVSEKRRLARKVVVLSLVSLALAIVFGLWFMRNWVRSVSGEFQQAEKNFQQEIFNAAIRTYDELASDPLRSWVLRRVTHKDVERQSGDARRFQRLHEATMQNMQTADSLYFLEQYADALNAYRQAADSLRQYELINYPIRMNNRDTLWRIDLAQITAKRRNLNLRLESTIKSLIDQFKIRQRDAETFVEAGVWGQALRNFLIMESLVPRFDDDKKRLQEALHLGSIAPDTLVAREIRRCKAQFH
jgi:hypothetical protein